MIEVHHRTTGIRIAPRKLRLVVDKMRHMNAEEAVRLLPLVNKTAAVHVQKSLKAAIQAAKDKNLNPETLVIQRMYADEGTAMKRLISHSRGRMAPIMKKHSHLSIVLKGEEAVRAKRVARAAKTEPAEETVAEEQEK